MTREAFALVAAAIRKELPRLEEQAAFVRDAIRRARKTRSRTVRRHFVASAALGLASLYDGMERLWRNIAERIDRTVPTGDRWHAELLRQMSLDIRGVRPPVLREETCNILDELRRFRHFVRPAYVIDIIEEKLKSAYEAMERGMEAFRKDAEAFAEVLEHLSTSESPTPSAGQGESPIGYD